MKKSFFRKTLSVASCLLIGLGAFDEPSPANLLVGNKTSAGKFEGDTVVITGASSGFGRGVAIELAREGANVVIASRRLDVLQKLATECGTNVTPLLVDVTNRLDVEHLAETAISKFGRIDVWINAAGVGAIGRFVEIPAKDQAQIVQTDLIGVIYGSHCALKQFEIQHSGTLINIASIVGEVPLAYYATYSAAKAGVVSLDRALRAELKADKMKNIHVCTVLPMATDTPFWSHAANYSKHTLQPLDVQKPEPVVNTIVKLIEKPRDSTAIGLKAQFAITLHRLNPEFVEDSVAKWIQAGQIEGSAASALPTEGAVFQPMKEGNDLSGGIRLRMENERHQ